MKYKMARRNAPTSYRDTAGRADGFDLRLPTTDLFNYKSIKRICDHLLNLRHLCAIFYFDTAPYEPSHDIHPQGSDCILIHLPTG